MSVEDLVAQKMGAPQPPQDAPPQEGMAPPQPPQDAPEPGPTAEEQAMKKGAPETEDKSAEKDPVLYDVEIDGKIEQMTPSQIAGMKTRYSSMNHENAELKPIKQVWSALKDKLGGDGAKASELLVQAMKKNAKMGNKPDGESHSEARNDERDEGSRSKSGSMEDLEKWAEENSVAIPPGYTDMLATNEKLAKQNEMLMQMMQEIRKQGQGVNEKAKVAEQQGQGDRAQAAQQRVEMNMRAAAEKAGVSEEQAQDFMLFVQQRGMDASDLIDPNMVDSLMSDFKNNSNGEELKRLREALNRRKAYSGSMGSAPQGADSQTPTNEAPHERLARMRSR